MAMPPEFVMREADDESDRKLLTSVKNVGWHVLNIYADETGPEYSFSVGLFYTFGAPEVLVMGLKHEIAHRLINEVGAHLATGKRFQEFERSSDLVNGSEISAN